MNDATANNATNQPVNQENEATPDVAVFMAANNAATAAATAAASAISNISHDAYLLASGLRLETELFLKGNTKNMADKYTINTTAPPDTPDLDNLNTSAQDEGSTDSNSLDSLINRKFAPYSTNTIKKLEKYGK